MDERSLPSAPTSRRRFLSLALLAGACAVIAALPDLLGSALAHPHEPEGTVRLVIDFGDSFEAHYTAIPWREGMTMRDAMLAAKERRAPLAFTFEEKGTGERAFVTSIAGIKGEGAGKESRNWLFWVNETPGERSFAVTTLQPGDAATWKFASYDALQPDR